MAARPHLVVFKNAGRDETGTSGLAWLESAGVAAAAVGHESARIGEARSTLDDGLITHVNAHAAAMGVRVGMRCIDAVHAAQAHAAPRLT